jgi:hypothetical protein
MAMALIGGLTVTATAQQETAWHRSADTVKLELQLFRSGQAFNLPTAETLQKHNLQFEVAHRFFPPVHEGHSLYGLDGPANIRIGLSFALSDRLLVMAAVSNANNNNDYGFKYKLPPILQGNVPVLMGLQGGLGWNTNIYGRIKGDSRNFQYYGQLVVNTMIRKRLGFGIVPSILYNSIAADSSRSEHATAIGGYVEYYFNTTLGVLAEWSPVVEGTHRQYQSGAFGIELNTGGHFFKILLTNSTWLNPTQYLAGSDYKFRSKDWRLGFAITRLLSFGHPK